MKCAFQVGDEVACVANEDPQKNALGQDWEWCDGVPIPRPGETYTVARLVAPYPEELAGLPSGWEIAVELAEFPGICAESGTPFRYPYIWFRKVEKKKQESSIEVFKEIDRKVFERQPEKVRA